ncbi:prickle-like protein 4 [Gastrophryne carolinensis]
MGLKCDSSSCMMKVLMLLACWLACSPDLNSIEHIWDIMSWPIPQCYVTPKTVQELTDALIQVCEEIPQENICFLIRIIPLVNVLPLLLQMAPDRPGQGTQVPATSSSDSDSGCALEEYLDIKTYPSTVQVRLSTTDAQELKLIQTLLQLLPPQDCDERFCTALGELERKELRNFSAYRKLHSMRHGVIVPVTSDNADSCCMRCGGKIVVGDTAVHALQDEGSRWHLECFVCETCHLPLSHFIYFLQDRRIYCGRHHAELTKSRCAACDQLILSERCTVAEGHCWHVEHFCCWECEEALGGGRYMMKGGRPFCNGCFKRLFAETCETCGEPVDLSDDFVTLKGQYWHSMPSCFCCTSCRIPLSTSEFSVHNDHLYCSHCCLLYGSRMYSSLQSQKTIKGPSNTQCSLQRSRSWLHHTPWNDTVIDCPGNKPSLQESSIARCQGGLARPFTATDSNTSDTWHLKCRHVLNYEEETSCSSSDSEPEGFFLGRPISNYLLTRGTDSPVPLKSTSTKRRQRSKSCKVS